MVKRVFLLLMNGLGVGPMPDSSVFHGHFQVNTLGNLSERKPNLRIPHLEKIGIRHLTFMKEHDSVEDGRYLQQAKLQEKNIGFVAKSRSISVSNDSLSVLWELAGLSSTRTYQNFCSGIPEELVDWFSQESNIDFLVGGCSGIKKVLKEFGSHHLTEGKPILFTTGDADVILAFHEKKFTMEQIYDTAKKLFLSPNNHFDFSRLRILPFDGDLEKHTALLKEETSLVHVPEGVSLFSVLSENDIPVIANEKIARSFDFVGFEEVLQNGDMNFAFQELKHVLHNSITDKNGRVVIVQSIDDLNDYIIPDKNVDEYANLLEKFDENLGELLRDLKQDDLLIITSLNGGDVTSKTEGITREYLPVLFYSRLFQQSAHLGIASSMKSISQTISDLYQLDFSFNVPNFPIGHYL